MDHYCWLIGLGQISFRFMISLLDKQVAFGVQRNDLNGLEEADLGIVKSPQFSRFP
jgi:hydroxymethylpyrimidine pyrophosphatase-like HAD family hydrolase